VFIEPGRAVTSDAQMLLASVLTTKAEADRTFVVLDAGINLAESCRSEYHRLLSATHADQADTRIYTIVGPICTPGDTLYWAARVPPLAPGDAVVIMDAGAYFVPFATSFSFPRPPIVLIDGQEVRLLRRGETFDDLIAHDQQQSAISAQVSPREHADIR
jgi:diaminopimelate decarboxylase